MKKYIIPLNNYTISINWLVHYGITESQRIDFECKTNRSLDSLFWRVICDERWETLSGVIDWLGWIGLNWVNNIY